MTKSVHSKMAGSATKPWSLRSIPGVVTPGTLRWLLLAVTLALLAVGISLTARNKGERGPTAEPSVASTGETGPGQSVAGGPAGPNSGNSDAARRAKRGTAAGESAGGSLPVSQGVTKDTIKLGIFIQKNVGAVAGALGVKGTSVGDNRAESQAVIDHLNARGGILDHKIVPVFFEYDNQNSNYESQEQAACSTWTEDNKVFAAAGAFTQPPTGLVECLAKRNTPYVFNNLALGDQEVFERNANFYFSPGGMNLSRLAATYVDGLVGQGFYDPGGRLGLLYVDNPEWRRAKDKFLKTRLAAHKIQLTEEVGIAGRTIADAAPQMQNAVLRFNSSRVTHVIFLDAGGRLAFTFGTQASSQGYYPRYGLSSYSAPNFLAQNVPPLALRGAVGVGYLPYIDVDGQQDPADNPQTKLCLDILRKAGQQWADRVAEHVAVSYCDALFFIMHALEREKEFTPGGLTRGAESLGTALVSPLTFTTRFAVGRHDGASSVRYMTFADDCRCFKYVGGLQPA